MCVAKKLNNSIILDRERPMPIEEILIKIKKVKYISTIDLRTGYWQVPLEEAGRAVCSFLFNGRNNSFTRMPFGLNVNGFEFQKCMDFVLGSGVRKIVTIYVDDIIIMSGIFDEHKDHLRQVFERFRTHNITVNLEKSKFFQPEVKFLGYIISTNGMRLDPEKLDAVMKFRPPRNKKEAQTYLGFLNFYRKYIEGFADIM